MSTEVYVSFPAMFFFGYMPRSGIAELYGKNLLERLAIQMVRIFTGFGEKAKKETRHLMKK